MNHPVYITIMPGFLFIVENSEYGMFIEEPAGKFRDVYIIPLEHGAVPREYDDLVMNLYHDFNTEDNKLRFIEPTPDGNTMCRIIPFERPISCEGWIYIYREAICRTQCLYQLMINPPRFEFEVDTSVVVAATNIDANAFTAHIIPKTELKPGMTVVAKCVWSMRDEMEIVTEELLAVFLYDERGVMNFTMNETDGTIRFHMSIKKFHEMIAKSDFVKKVE
jgi:hypothetical protein